jgi:hypothetical protein
VAPGDFDSADLQRILIDPEVYLAPDAAFWATVLASVPLAFTLDLDARAINQKVQGSVGTAVWDVYGKGLLTAGQRAEVGYLPVETNQP